MFLSTDLSDVFFLSMFIYISTFILDSCQNVQVFKAHIYPGILKKMFVPRSDVLKDDIFPLKIEEASVQTSGDNNLRKFREKHISSCK